MEINMHSYAELMSKCVVFTLQRLSAVKEATSEALDESGATSLVKMSQMIRLQKAILAVGMFSMFEANLQDRLGSVDGLDAARRILDDAGELNTKRRFDDLCLAINVLKHGRGRSYDALVAKSEDLPFCIRLPGESFFFEGDVSEISTLIEADDAFVQNCGSVICAVAEVIGRVRRDYA